MINTLRLWNYRSKKFVHLDHVPIPKQSAMKKANKLFLVIVFLSLTFILTSCAPGNEKFDAAPAGFLMGLWHGFISLFTFIISLFNDNVTIYEIENTGKLYNLGFILGAIIFYGGGSKSSCRRKK